MVAIEGVRALVGTESVNAHPRAIPVISYHLNASGLTCSLTLVVHEALPLGPRWCIVVVCAKGVWPDSGTSVTVEGTHVASHRSTSFGHGKGFSEVQAS